MSRYTPSQAYESMLRNIDLIMGTLRDFAETESSEAPNQIKLRACLCLIHAEIEDYIEMSVRELLDHYENGKLSKLKNASISKHLSLFSSSPYSGDDHSKKNRRAKIFANFRECIQKNNGIRKKDLFKMLMPLGFNYDSIDPAWVDTIDSFGVFRGDLVHKNHSNIRKTVGFRYFDETIKRIIIPGLLDLDEELFRLR